MGFSSSLFLLDFFLIFINNYYRSIMTKKNAPDLSDPSSPGGGSVCVGDDVTDTACSLEAPRKPRSEAQIAAFEKARTKRAANRAASAPAAPAAPPLNAREGGSELLQGQRLQEEKES